eukprot:5594787-Prymnesium_polylepis.2
MPEVNIHNISVGEIAKMSGNEMRIEVTIKRPRMCQVHIDGWELNLSIDPSHVQKPFFEMVLKTALYHFNANRGTSLGEDDIQAVTASGAAAPKDAQRETNEVIIKAPVPDLHAPVREVCLYTGAGSGGASRSIRTMVEVTLKMSALHRREAPPDSPLRAVVSMEAVGRTGVRVHVVLCQDA